MAKVIDHSEARKRRRIALTAFGHAAAACSAFPGRKVDRLSGALHKLARKIARQRGFRAAKKFSAFNVVGGDDYGKAMKARDAEPKVLMLIEQAARRGKDAVQPKGVKPTHILVAHTQDGHIIDIAEYTNR